MIKKKTDKSTTVSLVHVYLISYLLLLRHWKIVKGKGALGPKWPHTAGAYPGFLTIKPTWSTVKTRIKEHVFWGFRLILFLYIGCFLVLF